MKIIIIATFSLLVAGLIISFNSMKKNEKNPEAAVIEELQKRLERLESADQQAPNSGLSLTETLNTPSPLEKQAIETARQAEIASLRAELAEKQTVIAEKEAVIVENTIAQAAAKAKPKRPNRVAKALLMARVTKYHDEAKLVQINIERVGNVNTGDILGIRRNSEIIGRISVGTIDRDRAIADPLPASFEKGLIDIQTGDELILPPQF